MLTRQGALPVLHGIVVALVTRTVHGHPDPSSGTNLFEVCRALATATGCD
ncbi:MAG: hypothetical protein AVDCRST_MAG45-282 [uncultured Solirubrobacterales bacterium]|uniref:Uncharacterized protein n=1 Tax=uncultured Solirubrobacterales bacterium TaxID=768556 RepID=A0A6J4S1S1_9ACTN|nr:MAG: hypothetical protein AVDCRST_MAG45-282 [uncultured Solirubrobacterales bacterium]